MLLHAADVQRRAVAHVVVAEVDHDRRRVEPSARQRLIQYAAVFGWAAPVAPGGVALGGEEVDRAPARGGQQRGRPGVLIPSPEPSITESPITRSPRAGRPPGTGCTAGWWASTPGTSSTRPPPRGAPVRREPGRRTRWRRPPGDGRSRRGRAAIAASTVSFIRSPICLASPPRPHDIPAGDGPDSCALPVCRPPPTRTIARRWGRSGAFPISRPSTACGPSR